MFLTLAAALDSDLNFDNLLLSASFELMRKEQHKAFQEKNKFNQKENSELDITVVLGDTKDEKKILNKESELDEAPMIKDSNNDSSKTSLPSQTHASRPLVPPGFKKSINNSLEVIILYFLLIAYASSKLSLYYILYLFSKCV